MSFCGLVMRQDDLNSKTVWAVKMKFAYIIEPPFNYRDKNNQVTGCDVELAKTILKKIGIDRFEPVEAEFSELLHGLKNGQWQMTTGLFDTEARREMAAFGKPIWALPDGLLVRKENPKHLTGYSSISRDDSCVLGVIRDQVQHDTAIELGVPEQRIKLFETYEAAASAVKDGLVDAYASVGRAHSGFMQQQKELQLEIVVIPSKEKQPASGSFAFNKSDVGLINAVNKALQSYLGSKEHRSMMEGFGFTQTEVDLVAA